MNTINQNLLIVTPTLGDSPFLDEVVASVARLPLSKEHVMAVPATRVAELQARYPAVRVVPDAGKQGAIYGALNCGIEAARSDWGWFTYINDDDDLGPHFATMVLAHFRREEPEAVTYGDVETIDGAGARISRITTTNRPELLGHLVQQGISPLNQQGMLFRSDVVRKLKGFDLQYTLAADLDFWVRAYAAGFSFRFYPQVVGKFRIRDGQLSGDTRVTIREQESIAQRHLGPPGSERQLRMARWRFRAFNIPRYMERVRTRGWRRSYSILQGDEGGSGVESAEPMRHPDLIVLNDYASISGGSTAVAVAEAMEWAQRGRQVTLFAAIGPVDPELENFPNLEVICLNQPSLMENPNRLQAALGGLRNDRAVKTLRALLAGRNPEHTVVHAHTWMMGLSPWVLAVVSDMKFRLVVTLHDYFITCPTGGFYDHSSEMVCTRKPLSIDCLSCNCDRRNYGHKLWRSARTVLQNTVLGVPARVDHFIGVSAFSLERMRPFLPEGVPCSVVRNPVDYPDCERLYPDEHSAFIFVGRFVPEKGVRLFAQAINATGLPAIFVGAGELEAELRTLCLQATFTGWLNREEIHQQFAGARALVFPPQWYETLGLVAVEAMAAGLPVIVSDGCAARDFVHHGKTGLTFAHGDATSLAACMQELAGDGRLAARLGNAAYEWYWRDPWTRFAHVNELEEVYAAPTPSAEPVPTEIKEKLS